MLSAVLLRGVGELALGSAERLPACARSLCVGELYAASQAEHHTGGRNMVGYTLERSHSNRIFLGVARRYSLGATEHRAASCEKAERVLPLPWYRFDSRFVSPFIHVLPILRLASEPR